VISFALHWSFALELATGVAAGLAYRKNHLKTKTARLKAGPF